MGCSEGHCSLIKIFEFYATYDYEILEGKLQKESGRPLPQWVRLEDMNKMKKLLDLGLAIAYNDLNVARMRAGWSYCH